MIKTQTEYFGNIVGREAGNQIEFLNPMFGSYSITFPLLGIKYCDSIPFRDELNLPAGYFWALTEEEDKILAMPEYFIGDNRHEMCKTSVYLHAAENVDIPVARMYYENGTYSAEMLSKPMWAICKNHWNIFGRPHPKLAYVFSPMTLEYIVTRPDLCKMMSGGKNDE